MASQLKVDTLTGVTTAGSIAVTGEGNSTTTNLQQGLAKAWVHFDGTSTLSIKDSLNNSSVTDNATGQYIPIISSAMGNTLWMASVTGTASQTGGGYAQTDSSAFDGSGTTPYRTTTKMNIRGMNDSASAADHGDVNFAIFGDLA